MKLSIKYNLNFNIDFKSKPVIITLSVLAILLITAGVILYNIHYKYDSQDPFFKKLIVRANQLDDKYVLKKIFVIQYSLIYATSPNDEKGAEIRKIVRKDKNLTAKYIADDIIENPLPYPVFRHRSNKYFVKLIRALGWVKITDRSVFAKYYTDLNNHAYTIPYENQYTYVKLPYGSSLAFKITDPSCMTKSDAGRFYCGDAYLDINGKRGPNQLGVDLFDVGLYYKPYGYLILAERYGETISRTYCFKHIGQGCFYFAKDMDRSFLRKPDPFFVTDYNFAPRIPLYIYLTSNGKLVYFNRSGFDSFVNAESILYQASMIKANFRLPHPIQELKASYEAFLFVRSLQKQAKAAEKELNRTEPLPVRAFYNATGDPAPVNGVEPKPTLKQKYTKYVRDKKSERMDKSIQVAPLKK